MLWQTFRKVRSQFEAVRQRRRSGKACAGRREFLSARSRLALARGNREAALGDLKLACWFGKRCVEATVSAYDAGTVSFDLVLEAHRGQGDVELNFLRTYRVFGDPKKPVELPHEPCFTEGTD